MRKKLFFGLALSIACLYFVFRGISLRQLVQSLRAANTYWMALGMMVYSGGYFFRVLRWKIILRPIKSLKAEALFRPLIIGFFANNILPFRMGELVRAHITGQKFKISRTAGLGTIVLERLCDTLSFLTIFLVVALFLPFPVAVKKGAYLIAAGCGILIIFLILGAQYRDNLQKFLQNTKLRDPWKMKLRHIVVNFTQGISGMKRWGDIGLALLLSLIIWVIEGTTIYLIAHAFPQGITYFQSFFVLFFFGLAVIAPQAPGNVGTVELVGVSALSLLGIPRDQGLPMVIAIHGLQFGFIFSLGVWTLWTEKLSFRSLTQMERS